MTIANTQPSLSPFLDEYSESFITDENGNVLPVLVVLPLGPTGNTGSAALTISKSQTSNVTDRKNFPLVNTTGKPAKVMVLASVNASGVLGPLSIPLVQPYREVATSTTLVSGDGIIGVTDTSAPRTIALPAANSVPAGQLYRVKDESGLAGTNNITINRAGSDTIDGATSLVISANYGHATFYSNGATKWFLA